MSEPHPTTRNAFDDAPPAAAADDLLSLAAESPGPRGLSSKLLLGMLAVLLFFALAMAGLWAINRYGRSDALRRLPPVVVSPPWSRTAATARPARTPAAR